MFKVILQDVRQTAEYASFMQSLGWQTIQTKRPGPTWAYVKRLSLLPFSAIKILRGKYFLSSKKVLKLKRKYQAVIVKQEPFVIEKHIDNIVYFKIDPKNKWPLLPTKTLWIDLTRPKKNLLNRMKPKTRYNIKKARKNKLRAKVIAGSKISSDQLKQFYDLWSINKPHNFLFKPSMRELKSLVESFGQKCFCTMVSSNQLPETSKNLLACSLQLVTSNMSFYWHNASTDLGKKLFAPTLCVWRSILESKKRGLKVFDFEGVWDERFPKLNKDWKGFTKFKEGFVNGQLFLANGQIEEYSQ